MEQNQFMKQYSGGGSNGWRNVEGDLPDIPVRWGLYNKDNFNQVIVATESWSLGF